MPMRLWLPDSVAEVAEKIPPEKRHPGLQLDKYLPRKESEGPRWQEYQRGCLEHVIAARGDPGLLKAAAHRHTEALAALGAVQWTRTSSAPLTMHLSRAGALENAGISLHPVYGFPVLPGTGIKGVARSYAETIWSKGGDAQERDAAVARIFGSIRGEGAHEAAGSAVFHDAWPERWPHLAIDILTNHHSKYYQAGEDPGDFEEPIPVYFLAVKSGVDFRFAVSARSPATVAEDLRLARDFVDGGLELLGAGAKTAAGYGAFAPTAPPATTLGRVRSGHDLELVTPAFLAGAQQKAEDCDLRGATLRGLLRWWWRTLHSGYLAVGDLRELEAALWGSTDVGSPVTISIARVGPVAAFDFDREELARQNRLPKPQEHKTSMGLFYYSYGMDERGRRRAYADAGARWRLSLTTRDTIFSKQRIPADRVMRQAEAALWLLCRFGGIGSKSRKGFGSLADITIAGIATLDECRASASALRRACGLSDCGRDAATKSASLENMLPWTELETPWENHWLAIDRLGAAAQAFAKRHAHSVEKRALGLPRRIGPPERGSFHPPIRASKRHASPVHFHFARPPGGRRLVLRATAFPSHDLPDLGTSREFLKKFLDDLRVELVEAIRSTPDIKIAEPIRGPAPMRPGLPKAGDEVEVEIRPKKPAKDTWWASHAPSDMEGPITNSKSVPAEVAAGQTHKVVVNSINETQISFRWILPAPGKGSKGKRP